VAETDRRLAVFRAWFIACAAGFLYLLWIAGVEYRVRLHDPEFVLTNVAVLLVWWVVFVRMCLAWDRVRAVR
jgi:hypothetical protein